MGQEPPPPYLAVLTVLVFFTAVTIDVIGYRDFVAVTGPVVIILSILAIREDECRFLGKYKRQDPPHDTD